MSKESKHAWWLAIAVIILGFGSVAIYNTVVKPLSEMEALKTKYSKLYDEHDTIKKLLEEHKGANPEPDIVEWAYKNAKSHIPKIVVIQVLTEASKYETYKLMLAVFKEESSFDPFAKSSKGAKGLGQIRTKIPESGKSVWLDMLIDAGIWEAEIDVYDYRKNIAATDYILRNYKAKYGTWNKALFHYVNGDDTYVLKVLANYAELMLLGQQFEKCSENCEDKTEETEEEISPVESEEEIQEVKESSS